MAGATAGGGITTPAFAMMTCMAQHRETSPRHTLHTPASKVPTSHHRLCHRTLEAKEFLCTSDRKNASSRRHETGHTTPCRGISRRLRDSETRSADFVPPSSPSKQRQATSDKAEVVPSTPQPVHPTTAMFSKPPYHRNAWQGKPSKQKESTPSTHHTTHPLPSSP